MDLSNIHQWKSSHIYNGLRSKISKTHSGIDVQGKNKLPLVLTPNMPLGNNPYQYYEFEPNFVIKENK